MSKNNQGEIKDIKLAKEGKLKIEWAALQMPVLEETRKRFKKEKTLKGITIGACLHVTSETANLAIALKDGGATVFLCASNPLSTQDSVAASLVADFGISTFAIKGENNKTYYQHLNQIIDQKPQITMDDGGDLITLLHTKRQKERVHLLGSSEETTTGVIRLRAMEKEGELKVPVIAVNESQTKHLFDNRYGTGQSTLDGILRATNILLAGKTFVVVGYGWCGKGVATRARGAGANVIVCEIDPIRSLEAVMDGYRVMTIQEAAKIGDVFLTVTGNKHVISYKILSTMRDGAIIANAGHFDVEIDVAALEKKKTAKRELRAFLTEYTLPGKKRIFLLADGRLVNLSAAEGHPAEVMDMSFTNQALAAEYFLIHRGKLENKVYVLPHKIDEEVAALKLSSMGVTFDHLTSEQKRYLSSWNEGTE